VYRWLPGQTFEVRQPDPEAAVKPMYATVQSPTKGITQMSNSTLIAAAKLRKAFPIRLTFGQAARPPRAIQDQHHAQPPCPAAVRKQDRSTCSLPLFGLLVL
jgi:hypothetical protein